MAKPTHKPRKTSPVCPTCGEEFTLIWMKDGSVVLAEIEKIRVIFTNYANASGHYQTCWIKHECEKGKSK